MPAEGHVLADLGDHVGELLGNAVAAARIGAGLDLVEIAAGLQGDPGDVAHEVLEGLVAGHEVGLGIDLDHRAPGAFGGNADQTFGGHAAGLFRGGGEALLAQPVDSRLQIAAGLGQRLLAIHHPRAGGLAQLFDQRRGNFSHDGTLLL